MGADSTIGEEYEAHNAMADVTSLEKLYYSKYCVCQIEYYVKIFFICHITHARNL